MALKNLFFTIVLFSIGFYLPPLNANDKDLPKEEKLLRYQEVFHYFYRKDELNALVNLQSGFAMNLISPDIASNKLLLGALYNSYGLASVGQPILQQVTANSQRQNVKDLAWFYLSKQYFNDESFGKFENTVARIGSSLQKEEKHEQQYMLGIHYLKSGKLKKAENVLSRLESKAKGYPFLLFNLGAAYLQASNVELGMKYISQVGSLKQADEISLSLKDKANVVLGYQHLTASQPVLAIPYFEKVRLQGAFSQKALLGLGWAYSQMEQHRRALVPWLMLSEQDSSNVEVQEVLMAVPYTYNVLSSPKKAVELYQKSITVYESLKQKIDDAIGFVGSASLFEILFVDEQYDDYAISQQLKANLTTDLGRLLFELLKEEEIQVMLDQYRDLLQLQSETNKWNEKLERMNHIIGLAENDAQLPDLSHEKANGAFSTLPDHVAKKIKYKEQLLTLGNRVDLQKERLAILLQSFEQEIRQEVLSKLQERNQYVLTYLSQTRYSLAELLDKSQGGG